MTTHPDQGSAPLPAPASVEHPSTPSPERRRRKKTSSTLVHAGTARRAASLASTPAR